MSQKNGQEKPMTSITFETQIRKWIDASELRESLRSGTKRPHARATLARKWNVSFWTLTNIRRGRLKGLKGEIRDKIWSGVIREYETEISRLTHELQLARACREAPHSDEIIALESAISKANRNPDQDEH